MANAQTFTSTSQLKLKHQALKAIVRDATNDDLGFIKKLVEEEYYKRGWDIKFILFDVPTRSIGHIHNSKVYNAAIRHGVDMYIGRRWMHLKEEQRKNLTQALYLHERYINDDNSYIATNCTIDGMYVSYHCKVDMGIDDEDVEDMLSMCTDFISNYPISPDTAWLVDIVERLHADGIETPGIRIETVRIPLDKTYNLEPYGNNPMRLVIVDKQS